MGLEGALLFRRCRTDACLKEMVKEFFGVFVLVHVTSAFPKQGNCSPPVSFAAFTLPILCTVQLAGGALSENGCVWGLVAGWG